MQLLDAVRFNGGVGCACIGARFWGMLQALDSDAHNWPLGMDLEPPSR